MGLVASGCADGTRCVPDELTQFPPKAGYKFHPQVVPRVAITSEMGYDGETGLPKSLPLTDPRNHYWLERLKAWTAAAERVYIWEYTCERRVSHSDLAGLQCC